MTPPKDSVTMILPFLNDEEKFSNLSMVMHERNQLVWTTGPPKMLSFPYQMSFSPPPPQKKNIMQDLPTHGSYDI